MNSLSREQFSALLKEARIKSRLVREVRFIPEEIENWADLELLAISTRSASEGLLLIQTDHFYMIAYTLTTGLADKKTGRSKPITCDFCYTWQRGSNAGRITFRRATDNHTLTYLCCADLQCSLHVRNMTAAATLSRTQLHEDIGVDQRVARLKRKLNDVLLTLDVPSVTVPPG